MSISNVVLAPICLEPCWPLDRKFVPHYFLGECLLVLPALAACI